MKSLKDRKLHSLCNEFSTVRNSTTTHVNVHDKNIVVTIPDDLELTEAETSVLSKGLTFVPMNNKIDEYQVKADCEKYYLGNQSFSQATTNEDNVAGDFGLLKDVVRQLFDKRLPIT